MKYNINQTYYKDGKIFGKNKLPPRAYYIPFNTEKALEASFAEERAMSDSVVLLSGDWKFRLFDKVSEMPASLDTEECNFDDVKVPSVWQRTGHASPCYLNVRYEFPCKPPVIPEDIPVGVYCKRFELKTITAVTLLTFLGVTPCVTVYLNGKEIGYSEGSHNMAEFDVSDYAVLGENELVAVVHKWSTGTYLECQDMFRDNGIFRDVYVTQLANAHLRDFAFETTYNPEGTYDARINVSAENAIGCDVRFELSDNKTVIATRTVMCGKTGVEVKFSALKVNEWSAEIPNTYILKIFLISNGKLQSVFKRIVGFKHIEVRGNVFYFNNSKIKLRGMNHHDTSPTSGFVLTAADIERDVKLMKGLNINCVRTSHYPPDPYFIDCCAGYGLYVVDENDLETHGCNPRINRISNDVYWKEHYLDRISRLYFRDRSSPAITMWSLGNEAGGWKNQDACYKWLKEHTDIPVHYEGVIRTPRFCYDVISEMYTYVEKFKKIAAGTAKRRYYKQPFFLCEYCHTMGFAPGNIEDYWQAIYSADNMLGGCIWEWADHAVYHADGKYRYTYGGDHGEKMHDGNFCCDGTMYPDRTPSVSSFAVKNAYRPVRSAYVGDGVVRFENKLNFSATTGIKLAFELKNAGKVTESGELPLDISAGESRDIKLGALKKTDDDCLLNLTYIGADGVVGVEQHIISAPDLSESKVKHVEIEDVLSKYVSLGVDLINIITPTIVRAPLDNDRNFVHRWEKDGYFNDWTLTDTTVEGRAVLRTFALRNGKGKDIITARIRLDFLESGVRVRTVFDPKIKGGYFMLPRLGVVMELPESFSEISYTGYGPRINLPDLLSDTIIGEYRATSDDFDEPFIMPQTSGTHCGTRTAELYGKDGKGIKFSAIDNPFVFSCSRYTVKQIKDAAHREDLPQSSKLYVGIDGYIMGSGNNSCGDRPTADYVLKFDKPFGFSFRINERK